MVAVLTGKKQHQIKNIIFLHTFSYSSLIIIFFLMHNDLRLQRECLSFIFNYGWSSKEVSDYKKISDSTIRNWKYHYLFYGRSPAMSRRERRRLGPRVDNRKLTVTVQNALRSIVEEKPWLYLDEF